MAGDTSGVLELATNGSTTAITIDASQRAGFVAGTALLAGITTTGDTNTGIFLPAADTIALAEGGTEAMRIDSSGNVLVGTTTSPSSSNSIRSYGAIYEGPYTNSSTIRFSKVNNTNNVTTATVTLITTNNWYANFISFIVSSVRNNVSNNVAARYVYRVATNNGTAGDVSLVDSGGNTASFTVSITGNSGTGSQVWTISVTAPVDNDRNVLSIEVGSSLGISNYS